MNGIESYPLNRYLVDSARGRRRDHQFFFYEGRTFPDFTAIGQVRTLQINIDKDAPFLFMGIRGEVFRTTDPFVNLVGEPDLNVMIRYGGPGGRPWAQTAVHWRNCTTNRGPAYIMPVPKMIDAGSMLHVTLTVVSDASWGPLPWQVRMQFMGSKLFRWRAA